MAAEIRDHSIHVAHLGGVESLRNPWPEPRVLDPQTYFDTLLTTIPQEKQRVLIAAGYVVKGPQVNALLEVVRDAGRRIGDPSHLQDSRVVLRTNQHLFRLTNFQPFSPRNNRTRGQSLNIADLESGGVRMMGDSDPSVTTIIRPDHRKIVVVGDTTYIGGVDLSERAFSPRKRDFMVQFHDPFLADQMADVILHPERYNTQAFVEFECPTSNLTIMLDTGRRRRKRDEGSIQQRVHERFAQARERIKLANQYVPDWTTDMVLRLAQARGIDVQAVSHLHMVDRIDDMNRALALATRFYHDQNGNSVPYQLRFVDGVAIHAKVNVVDEGTPGATADFGSHNMITAFGPAVRQPEILARTSSPELVNQLAGFVNAVLAEAR